MTLLPAYMLKKGDLLSDGKIVHRTFTSSRTRPGKLLVELKVGDELKTYHWARILPCIVVKRGT